MVKYFFAFYLWILFAAVSLSTVYSSQNFSSKVLNREKFDNEPFCYKGFIDGTCKWVANDTKTMTEKDYTNGQLQSARQYRENGMLETEWIYEMGREKSIHTYHENGGLYQTWDFNRDGMGSYKSFHEKGYLWGEGPLKNGKREGTFKTYNEDGSIDTVSEYQTGELHGMLKDTVRGSDGKPGERITETPREVQFIHGKEEGLAKYYYPNGILARECFYKKGKLDGVSKEYYASGKLRVEELYRDDRPDGARATYYENGVIASTDINKNGIPIYSKIFDEQGRETLDISCDDNGNEKERIYKDYFANGNLKCENFFHGDKVVLERRYYKSGGIYSEMSDNSDKFVTYYKNGNKRLENLLGGHGQRIRKEFYENGIIHKLYRDDYSWEEYNKQGGLIRAYEPFTAKGEHKERKALVVFYKQHSGGIGLKFAEFNEEGFFPRSGYLTCSDFQAFPMADKSKNLNPGEEKIACYILDYEVNGEKTLPLSSIITKATLLSDKIKSFDDLRAQELKRQEE
jgi:antitoxin component YwqK of YwqJK toxin-antitoxin module